VPTFDAGMDGELVTPTVRRCRLHLTIKSTLKAPGTKRLKLDFNQLLSIFAFKFNLRHYTTGACLVAALKTGVSRWPDMTPTRCAYGAGTKRWADRPNLLRLVMGERLTGR